MNILIPTKPDDAHAFYAQLALAQYGHHCQLWYTADYPTQQVHSFDLCDKEITWHAKGIDFEIENNAFDLVWYRRPRKPYLPQTLHPDDKENAEKENAMFFQTFWLNIAKDATWVNPPNAAKAANSKLLQLSIAKQIGLQIPATLISNDKDRIVDFISHFGDDRVIYKTLYPMMWLRNNEINMTYTRQVKLNDLPEKEIMQMTPGIFQQRIDKAFELRVTFFGDFPVTAKLNSQEHPKGKMDWRYIPTHQLNIEPFELPDIIKKYCIKVMRQLGLVFGCFDFIVTKDNEYYFLELNESGQFLWIEENNPDFKLLDIFTKFVIAKGKISYWQKTANTLSLHTFKQNVADICAKKILIHKNPEI